MPHQRVSHFLRSSAREMRSAPVNVERDLWWRLRGRKLGGLKFRRQHPIGGYVADFACLEATLIIELDGKQHRGSVDDIARTENLVGRGFKVIRFDNDTVRADIDRVCAEILETATWRLGTPHPSAPQPPSPTRGEG
jgi:very-short-patch-repair endonuclease